MRIEVTGTAFKEVPALIKNSVNYANISKR